MVDTTCSTDDCNAPVHALGRCRTCYFREYMRARRAAKKRAVGPRSCARCGADIIHRDLSARYCSTTCQERDYREANRVTRERHCRECGTDISHRYGKALYCSMKCANTYRYQRDPESQLLRSRAQRERVRCEVFEHFGTSCVRCGSTDELHLDHVNQDGKEHRELLASRGIYQSGEHFYRHLIANGFDTDGYELQVLCGPCNRRKGHTMSNTSISLAYTQPGG